MVNNRRSSIGTTLMSERERSTTIDSGVRSTRFQIGGVELAVVSVGLRPAAGLPSAEAGVLRLVMAGWSNARIAAARGTSTRTVANQVAGLFRKFGVASRAELAVAVLAPPSGLSEHD